MKICLVVPAYNEEQAIGKTVSEYREAFPEACIIVVDNNSSDSTAEKARMVLDEEGDLLLTETRQGKGFAVKTALSRLEADIYVMTDGDATYPAADARRLVDAMFDMRADMVVGDRVTNGAYMAQNSRMGHNYGNRLLTFVISVLAGQRYNDVLSGLRVMSRPFVAALDVRSSGFQLETELNVIAAYLRAHVVEIPVDYRARGQQSSSKLNTIQDGFRILSFAVSNWIAFAPMQPFMILAIVSGGATLLLALRILLGFLAGYIALGSTYSTTAAAAAVFGLIFVLSIFFGMALRILGRNDRRREIARFLESKRRWNSRLDDDTCKYASENRGGLSRAGDAMPGFQDQNT